MSNRYIGGVVTETTNVAQSPWSGSWTEQAAMQGFGSVLKITNSLRFRASASAYLSRTFGTPTSQQLMTFSFWVKRGLLAKNNMIWNNFVSASSYGQILFGSSDSIEIYSRSGGATTQINLIATQVFRDPSAWYHIVVAVDTTQATASNRVKLYVNGSQVTSFSTATYPSQNDNINFEISGRSTAIGVRADLGDSTQNLDGYMAEINFIDGQALDPTAFGAINKETGVWAPIAYAGTYGLNGFHLDFKNATSTTTLGYDTSGNGNNWTTNNISLTAGSTYDWMIDSPSKIQGTGYGVGNYAVLNPLDSSNQTTSNGNLSTISNGSAGRIRGTIGVTTGKFYWEHTLTSYSAGGGYGVMDLNSQLGTDDLGVGTSAATSWGVLTNTGAKYNNGTSAAYGTSATTNDVIMCALDMTTGYVWWGKNGTWFNSGNPATGANPAFTNLSGYTISPAIGLGTGSSQSWAHNFGQRPFAYTPPTGYQTLCTQNLPVATIYNGAQYMAATLYTGNGATNLTVANANNSVSFQPGFVWIKKRGPGTANHCLNNEVMGVGTGVSLYTASTSAAGAYDIYGYLSALTSTGFTTQKGTDPTYPNDLVNESGSTYVAWQWKAGGTAVTNTAGSITSQVSANTTAGFSVVTYTGDGASSATVGHGLGVTPAFVIIKSRAIAQNWVVYHVSGGLKYLVLNSVNGWSDNTNLDYWYSLPTSSAFYPDSSPSWPYGSHYNNTSGQTYVAYCFAAIPGYSAFGSYTGNGSADGPFVFLGFRPRWIMVKATAAASASDYWWMFDTSRLGYNVHNANLAANVSDAESDDLRLDILSNGFKLRVSYTNTNASGVQYIYAAFAENPFSVALAR